MSSPSIAERPKDAGRANCASTAERPKGVSSGNSSSRLTRPPVGALIDPKGPSAAMRLSSSTLHALVLALAAGCGGAPPRGAPSTPPPAPRPEPPPRVVGAAELAGLEARAVSTVQARAPRPPGQELVVRGFVWRRPVQCSPCPPTADCGRCPPFFFYFGSRPRAGVPAGDPEQPLAVRLFLPGERLDAEDAYLLVGRLGSSHEAFGNVVLEVSAVYGRGRELFRLEEPPAGLLAPPTTTAPR